METNNPETENLHTNPFELLSRTQWRYITAMIEDRTRTKKDAAEHLELNVQTIYRWPSYVDEALELALADLNAAALECRKQQLLKAIGVKVAGLDSEDENIRQRTATEIIEWELGKATQKQEHTGKEGGAITWEIVYRNIDERYPDTKDTP